MVPQLIIIWIILFTCVVFLGIAIFLWIKQFKDIQLARKKESPNNIENQ